MTMLPRDRVIAAIEYRTPDVIPVRIFPAAGGLHEHGQKLVDLIQACGHDFGDLSGVKLPDPPKPDEFDPDGSYHAFRTDAWGTRWEHRIFGIWGHPVEWPLNDLSKLGSYRPPEPPAASGPEFERARAATAAQRQTWYTLGWGGMLFEQLRAVRRFEDVLMDIACDTPEINRIADMIAEYMMGCVRYALALGVDGISFGDDFGTSNALMVSPVTWRRFFKPRYEALCAPIRLAGKRVFLHSCGQIGAILGDVKELGMDVIWPQLPVYDPKELARRCRDLGLCIELHPDRGELMQRGTPAQIRDHVRRLVDIFDTPNGGSWLYLEVDPGFPWKNVEALFGVAMEMR